MAPSDSRKRHLRSIGEAVRLADRPVEKLDLVHAVNERKAVVARPTGVGRAISTYTIPIEGRDEWLAAARRLA